MRFAEVNRRVLQELGVSFFAARQRFLARGTTQQFSAPSFDDGTSGTLTFNDFLNLFFFDRQVGYGVLVRALQQRGAFQSLAEPNLIAYNGQEASFLAGGEFPIPAVQGTSGAVSVTFKEFGIRLKFRPTIAGDAIRLKVAPEVSTLDFANGVSLGGFRIPALTTRRAETDVELRDGQSFAIAGLLDNVSQEDSAAIPILSKLPIIGAALQIEGGPRRADRAHGADYSTAGARAGSRRGSAAADEVQAVPRWRGQGQHGKDFEGTGPVDAPDQAKSQAAADKADKNSKRSPADTERHRRLESATEANMKRQGSVGDERGAITIHVAIALIALLSFTTIVIDYGIMWVARRQGQNAADAAALAGAGTLSLDPTGYDEARQRQKYSPARTWSGDKRPRQPTSWCRRCRSTAPTASRPASASTSCAASPIATVARTRIRCRRSLGRMIGVNSQGIRATATAQVANGNAVECIKPWVVSDKWTDISTGAAGGLTPSVLGSDGFLRSRRYLYERRLGVHGERHAQPIRLAARAQTGTDRNVELRMDNGDRPGGERLVRYQDEIEGCPAWVPTVGLYDPSDSCPTRTDEDPVKGCIGVKTGMSQGPTSHGVHTLTGLDSGATWDSVNARVQGGCMARRNVCQSAGCTRQHQSTHRAARPLRPRFVYRRRIQRHERRRKGHESSRVLHRGNV